MASKFLASLSKEEYTKFSTKLWQMQNSQCFICEENIDLELNETNIDHIKPLANKGKDTEENLALTHASCNKSKQDANLHIAKSLQKLKKIQWESHGETGKPATLKDVLKFFGGSKFELRLKCQKDEIQTAFSHLGEEQILKSKIFVDKLSQEKTFFLEVPIEYLFHDGLINPRGINASISKLVKEFDKGNPQLHLCLARLNNSKIEIFDGQHKAVAQLLLGVRRILIRCFLSPNLDRLTETNTNAGSSLRQIAFDKSIMRQLNNTLYSERVKKYQSAHGLAADNFGFSEQQLIDFFKGDGANIRRYITDSIKYSITDSAENRLKGYIDHGGKAKELPISYSAFDKTLLSSFVSSKRILKTPIDFRSDQGVNPRELEIEQIVKILNILADKIYINKFLPEVGTWRIEKKIIDQKDQEVTDDHLIAYRISKEEIMYNWVQYLKMVVKAYFTNTGQMIEDEEIFQKPFDEQLWKNLESFIENLSALPLWRDRSMAPTVFAGKNTYDYWKEIFDTGSDVNGATVLARPLNFMEMIKPN